jgi:hypothetical protein
MFGKVPRIYLVTTFAALLIVGLMTLGAGAGNGKKTPRNLFDVPVAADVLTPAQKKILDRIKKSRGYVKDQKPQIVKLNKTAVADLDPSQPVAIPLHAGKTLTMEYHHFTAGLGTVRVNWGKPYVEGQSLDFASLSVGDKNCTGLIYNADKVFSVENLGGGMQAIVEIDQSKYDDEHKDHKAHPPIPKNIQLEGPAPMPNAPAVIRVLVAYTPKVESEVADMVSLIDGAINISNQSYKNSDVRVKLELALSTKFNFKETGDLTKDLETFRTDPAIAKQRDKAKADVCVLLLDTQEACGLAAAILADAAHAFCVVHYDCAVSNLSFPHEIGHLQGARHNLEVDPTIDPMYPFNHGYLSIKGNWRTIMAYPAPGKPIRIPYWSNPNKTFGTPPNVEPMGTAKRNDNARMLNLSAGRVSSFR